MYFGQGAVCIVLKRMRRVSEGRLSRSISRFIAATCSENSTLNQKSLTNSVDLQCLCKSIGNNNAYYDNEFLELSGSWEFGPIKNCVFSQEGILLKAKHDKQETEQQQQSSQQQQRPFCPNKTTLPQWPDLFSENIEEQYRPNTVTSAR